MDRFDDPMDRTAPPPSLISVSYLHHGYMVQFYCPLLVCLKKTFAVWLLLNWIYWWGSFLILENNSKLLPQLSLIEMYPFVSQKCHSCGFRFPLSCLFIVAYLAIDDLLLLFPNKYNRLGSWSLSVPNFFLDWLLQPVTRMLRLSLSRWICSWMRSPLTITISTEKVLHAYINSKYPIAYFNTELLISMHLFSIHSATFPIRPLMSTRKYGPFCICSMWDIGSRYVFLKK